MKEQALGALRQLKQFWDSLSTIKRLALISVLSIVLCGVLAISYFGSQEKYAFLFTDLNAEDASAIATKLKELKVPFRVEAGGSALQVPEDRVHELRLQVAGLGLPRGGGVGFELFDKQRFGATEFEQHLNFRRALEGELSRTIGTVGAVQSARVHLALPEKTVFTANREEASASVVLKLRPGRTFGRPEVSSIVHLVSSAVPGLNANRVSIVSSDGLTLHRPQPGGQSGHAGGDALVERESEMATAMEGQVRAMLERVVGPGRAEVRVNVSLDSSAKERTEEHFEPSKTALRSEQRSEERSGSPESAGVAGVPGAQSNLPAPAGSTETVAEGPTNGPEGSARTSWTRNWEVDKVTERTATPPGRIARLSVAVLVDGTYKDVGGAQQYSPREQAELTRLANLVKGAVGFEAGRGDVVQIDSAQFAKTTDGELGQSQTDVAKKWPKWWYYAAAGAAGLFLLSLVILVARRRRSGSSVEASMPDALSPGDEPMQLPDMGASFELAEANRVAVSREEDRTAALDLAARDPATAAVILREWLNQSTAPPPNVPARF